MAKTVRVNAAEFQEKHARNLKASLPDMRRGIERVTEAPTEKAASQADKMVQNLTASVQAGKWQAGLRRVTLADWKTKMIDKGLPRVSGGIDAAKAKTTAFAQDLIAHENALLGQIDALPDMTLDDSINRASAWIRGMATFRRSG